MPGLRVASGALPYGPLVTFKTQGILPPSAVYVSPDDSVVLWVRNPSFATTVSASIRLLTPTGEMKLIQWDNVAASMGTAAAKFTLPPTEGFIISVAMAAPASTRGQVFVKLFLQRGANLGTLALGHVLIQGYLSDDDRLSYPQSPTESSLEGRGFLHVQTIAAPGPGVEWTITVPAGVHWILRAVYTLFTASAAAANRNPAFEAIDNTGSPVIYLPMQTAVTAGQAFYLQYAPGVTAGITPGLALFSGLPQELRARGGWIFKSTTLNLQAGDTYSVTDLTVEEYIGE